MRKIPFLVIPALFAYATPLIAQDMGGYGPDMAPDTSDTGGEAKERPPRPKAIKREHFDKIVTGMFQEADSNHDGQVTIDELRALIEVRRNAVIRARFDHVDTNHNGAVTLEEFVAWQKQLGSVASSETGGFGDQGGPVAEAVLPQLGNDPDFQALGRVIEPLSVTTITQANSNYDAGLSLQELLTYEGKRFEAADENRDGWLTIDEMRSDGPPRGPRKPGGPAAP